MNLVLCHVSSERVSGCPELSESHLENCCYIVSCGFEWKIELPAVKEKSSKFSPPKACIKWTKTAILVLWKSLKRMQQSKKNIKIYFNHWGNMWCYVAWSCSHYPLSLDGCRASDKFFLQLKGLTQLRVAGSLLTFHPIAFSESVTGELASSLPLITWCFSQKQD